MICLHYQDERELAQALLSLARRCQKLAARLVFFGSEATSNEARQAVGNLDPSSLPGLTFRPLPQQCRAHGGPDVWHATIEIIRTALLEASVMNSPMVAWVESPVPGNGTSLRPALRDYNQSVDTTSRSLTPIFAEPISVTAG